MTLRELLNQVVDKTTDPSMKYLDYELQASNPENWAQNILPEMVKIDETHHRIKFELSHEQLTFLERFEI